MATVSAIANFALDQAPYGIVSTICAVMFFGWAAANCNKAINPQPKPEQQMSMMSQQQQQQGMYVPPVMMAATQQQQQQQMMMSPMQQMPGQQMQRPMVVAGETVPQASVPSAQTLDSVLTAASLTHIRGAIVDLGVEQVADFDDVTDEDLAQCGLKPLEVKRLRRHLK
jgi:hypothetical protein